jgi:hypothetical protein
MRTHLMNACVAACALVAGTSFAANGRIAASMTRDAWLAAQLRAQARLKPVATLCADAKAPPDAACRNEAKPKQKAI